MKKSVAGTPVVTNSTTDLEALMRAAVLEHLGARKEDAPKSVSAPKPEKPVEHIARKLDACIKYSSVEISDEEKKMLMAFLTADEVIKSSSGSVFRMLASDDNFMQSGLSDEEKTFCLNGINAVQRVDKKGKQVLNISLPVLDSRLHAQSYRYELKKAVTDWVIHLMNLQVRGYRVNGKLEESKEVKSDREYLNKVLEKVMTSELVNQVAEAIGNSPVYSEVYTTSVVYIPDASGKLEAKTLFRCDAVEHAKAMAEAFRNEDHAEDLLQGSLAFLDVAGIRVAMVDMAKPSLYLHKGKQGYRPNLYIPSQMVQDFLAVEPDPVEETGTAEVKAEVVTKDVSEVTAEAVIPD